MSYLIKNKKGLSIIGFLMLALQVSGQMKIWEASESAYLAKRGVKEFYLNSSDSVHDLSKPNSNYVTHGFCSLKGKPKLLLLHGITGTALLHYSYTMDYLRKDFDVVAIDLRGHGQTVNDTVDFSIEAQVEFVADALYELSRQFNDPGFESVIVVGHSYGGVVAASLAEKHPDMVRKLIIYDSPVGQYSSKSLDSLAIANGLPNGEAILSPKDYKEYCVRMKVGQYRLKWVPKISAANNAIERYFEPRRKEQMGMIAYLRNKESYLYDHKYNWKCRVLLLWGANDQIVPLSTALAIQKVYSDYYGKEMELFVYPKTGHVMSLERPRKFAKFLKEHASVKTYRTVGTPSF
ncbi:MAG: hypothetical protein RL362_365 [Bacteroidota bacterium]